MKITHDINALRTICTRPTEPLTHWGTVTDSAWGPYVYMDRGQPILAVAHLDTVMRPKQFACARAGRHDRLIVSPALDDRLGVYIVTHILPALGIDCDVLLTTDEELGQSTAAGFEPSHPYRWIFSFDRRAPSFNYDPTVVLYDYDDQSPKPALRHAGFKIETGSYSDIADLTHLGVIGFNFTAGYHNEHSRACYALMSDVDSSIRAFLRLHAKLGTDTLPYTVPPVKVYTYKSRSEYGIRGAWKDDDWRNPNPYARTSSAEGHPARILHDSLACWEPDEPSEEDGDEPLDYVCDYCGWPVGESAAYDAEGGQRLYLCDPCLDRMTSAPTAAQLHMESIRTEGGIHSPAWENSPQGWTDSPQLTTHPKGGNHKTKTRKHTSRCNLDRLRPRTRTSAARLGGNRGPRK